MLLLAACTADEPAGPPPPTGALVAAAAAGDADEVRRLLRVGAEPDEADADRRTAVTHAAYGGHADVVRLLLEAGADVDRQDATRANPLLSTGETGFLDVLDEVLRADPDLERTNRFGGTALIPAADRGHVETVRRLLETEIDVDHVNDLGWTALLEAVILGDGGPAHTEIVRLLVDAGADVRIPDREGVTALEHARNAGYDEIVAILDDRRLSRGDGAARQPSVRTSAPGCVRSAPHAGHVVSVSSARPSPHDAHSYGWSYGRALPWSSSGSSTPSANGSTSCSPIYSTVTVFARLRGWSTFRPRSRAMRYARSWSGITASAADRKAGAFGT